MEYKTILRNHVIDDEVNQLIKKGYKPLGGVSIVNIDGKMYMSQAMIKTANKGVTKRFIPPTDKQVDDFAEDNDLNLKGFRYFYGSKNWMVGQNKMKDWKLSAKGWDRRGKEGNKQPLNLPKPKLFNSQKIDTTKQVSQEKIDRMKKMSKTELNKINTYKEIGQMSNVPRET